MGEAQHRGLRRRPEEGNHRWRVGRLFRRERADGFAPLAPTVPRRHRRERRDVQYGHGTLAAQPLANGEQSGVILPVWPSDVYRRTARQDCRRVDSHSSARHAKSVSIQSWMATSSRSPRSRPTRIASRATFRCSPAGMPMKVRIGVLTAKNKATAETFLPASAPSLATVPTRHSSFTRHRTTRKR